MEINELWRVVCNRGTQTFDVLSHFGYILA